MEELSNADEETVLYKDVVIVGNGPGGIFLSYMLNGNWPYYTGQPHPGDEMLSARLNFINEEIHEKQQQHQATTTRSHLKRHTKHVETNSTCKAINKSVVSINTTIQSKVSLLQCSKHDLEILTSGIEGRGTFRPLSHLLDQLQHPCVDAGLNLPGLLDWRSAEHCSNHDIIDHVVLGKGPPGGAWQFMDPNVLTVSLNRWMSLPGLDLEKWENLLEVEQLPKTAILRERLKMSLSTASTSSSMSSASSGQKINKLRRIPVAAVAAYYKDYVNRQGLAKYFKSGRTVTSVRPIPGSKDTEDNYNWSVQGYESLSGRRFRYKCKSLVLATGTTNTFNRLGLPGEESQSTWVTHNLNDLESRLDRLTGKCKKCGIIPRDNKIDPVVVVGAGLSAADAIMAARSRGIPVIHAFREANNDNQDDNLGVKLSASVYDRLQSLPVSMYPEYHEIYEMMVDPRYHRLYKAMPGYKLVDLGVRSSSNKTKERRVSLQAPNGQIYTFQVSTVAILIGFKPDLSYLGEYDQKFGKIVDEFVDGRSNPIEVDDFTYEVVRSPKKGLYALGPLVGDNFVRFILGGAFGVAADILRNSQIE